MKQIPVVLCCIIFSVKGFSQSMSSLSGASIGVSYTLEPERKFKDVNGGYKYNAIGLNAKIPLFGKREPGHFYETSLQADVQSTATTFGFLNNTRRHFTNASLGLGTVIYNGGKNIYMINAGVGIASDDKVIKNSTPRYRFSGIFIVNHQHNSRTVYQYGAAFTYSFGTPLPLPVLGLRTKLSDHWTFSTILPVEVSFTDRIDEKAGLTFSLRPAGNRFEFYNNEAFLNTQSPTVFLQLREFQLSSSIHYKISKSFTISGEAGLLFGSQLKFTEEDDPKNIVFQTAVNSGVLLRASLRYRLPRKKAGMGGNRMQELLNPLGN